jgi:hypothetical protein
MDESRLDPAPRRPLADLRASPVDDDRSSTRLRERVSHRLRRYSTAELEHDEAAHVVYSALSRT